MKTLVELSRQVMARKIYSDITIISKHTQTNLFEDLLWIHIRTTNIDEVEAMMTDLKNRYHCHIKTTIFNQLWRHVSMFVQPIHIDKYSFRFSHDRVWWTFSIDDTTVIIQSELHAQPLFSLSHDVISMFLKDLKSLDDLFDIAERYVFKALV